MMKPDLVFYNGVIRTLDHRQPLASAIAVWGDRIGAVGTDDLRFTLDRPAEAIDLAGRLVLPGFVDSHTHFVEHALRRARVDLSGACSLEAALERVRTAVAQTPPGKWILGGRWDPNIWPDPSFPDKRSLDHLSCEHPMALDSKDGHTLWVNSLALQRAGIDDTTPDPPGGKIVRWAASGEAAGILREIPAKKLVWDAVGSPRPEALAQAIREATSVVWRAGVTGIHDCEDRVALRAFQALRRSGDLGLRVLMHLDVNGLDAAIQAGMCTGLGDEWIRIGGVKIFMDGALGSRTGYMLEPYLNDPGNRGMQVTTREGLADLLRRALPNGISVAVHAIGDAANRMVLDELEGAQSLHPGHPPLRHRIEHVQIISLEDIPRLAQLKVIASVQPLHAPADYEMVERYWGEPRAQGAYPFKSLLRAGARLVLGTDCPVEACDPLANLYAAVTRRRPDGAPGAAGWHPRERLTIEESIAAHTREPAYAAGEEMLKGTLAPGKAADLVILSQDIVTLSPDALPDTQVDATLVAGKIVFRAPAWS